MVSAPLCKEEHDEHCQSPTAVNVSDQTIRNRTHEGGLRARRPVVDTVELDWHLPQNTRIGRSATGALCFSQMRAGFNRAHVTDVTGSGDTVENVMPPAKSFSMTGLVTYAGAVGPGFLLVHNNARLHVARVCRQFLENEGIDTIDWPTGSPDLNPIEHLWDIMFWSIRRHQVALQTVQELSDALVQMWEETIRRLSRSMWRPYKLLSTILSCCSGVWVKCRACCIIL
ncbi:hypothetical protein NFI96_033307 [Prochilodus magdalenae]|nr:hypothetical protein NFI96_033307 [Prochilodus magdalenae]